MSEIQLLWIALMPWAITFLIVGILGLLCLMARRSDETCRKCGEEPGDWPETEEEYADRWRSMTAEELAREAVGTFQHCDDDPCVCQGHIEQMFAALLRTESGGEATSKVVKAAREVMAALEEHGPSIVPHLLDTDDNPGQRLREAIEEETLRTTAQADPDLIEAASDAFNLLDGGASACPVDDPKEWKGDVLRRLGRALATTRRATAPVKPEE